MIAVIGAGLAGLSCAYHLAKRDLDYNVFEMLDEPGGLCRSYTRKGYTFDLAGHYLHLRTSEGKSLARKYFGANLDEHVRRASVRMLGVRVPFPFQAHLGALPPDADAECLSGFIEAQCRASPTQQERFDAWVLDTFGKGMAKHFFFPYNSKFWKCDLHNILLDWTTWSIPRPSLEEVVRGALGLPNPNMGYNPRFLYPPKGGAGSLVNALAGRVKNIRLNSGAREIDVRKKVIYLTNGEEAHYSAIVSTMPLPALMAIVRGVDPAIGRAARNLSWLAVDCVQLGLKRPGMFDDHWSYIPEKNYPFYRVGKYPGKGKGTRLFLEFTRKHGTRFPGERRLVDSALAGLKKLGIVKNAKDVEEAHALSLDPAYVIFDRHRRAALPKIQAWLKKHRIYTIGRYGAWEYSSMEDALVQGLRIAESL